MEKFLAHLRLAPFKQFFIPPILIFASLPDFSMSLDENRLWLPISYQTEYLKLKEAALKAESLERCESILEGTLDTDRSIDGVVLFRLRCKQPDGRIYTEMVDGVTMETLTTSEIEVVHKNEEGEQRKQTMWQACAEELQQRTRLMINIEMTEEMPIPDPVDEQTAKFIKNFTAEGVGGEKLSFQAVCISSDREEGMELKIGKKPD